MRKILLGLLLLSFGNAFSQKVDKAADSLRKQYKTVQRSNSISEIPDKENNPEISNEDAIRNHLIELALQNPSIKIDDANIEIAKLNRKKAGASWLGSLALGGNINEFVIKNSEAASFFPKYNMGISIPFDIFSSTKNEKRVANQNILIANATKLQHINAIKAEVLTRYENYKEKRALVALQNISVGNNYADYLAAQKKFSDGSMTVEEMNKIYQSYLFERSNLITLQREENVSIIQLEEVIGIPLNQALPNLAQ